MSRSVFEVTYSCGFQELKNRFEGILAQNGYHPYKYEGENVWKKGVGVATAMMYIKIDYNVGAAAIQGWIMVGLGSAEMLEQALDGVAGVIPKKACRKVIDRLIQAAESP